MTASKQHNTKLGSGLKTRHLTMMGLGSAIGAGLFLGTGVGIQIAGPAVLLAYIFAGAIVVFVMQMLGEMAAARPAPGSFSTYGQMAFGHWAGFTLGWLYWFMLTMVMGAEMTGASAIMGHWFGVEPWIPALVCVVFFSIVNLSAVRGFGEFEFWFAFIKIAVIAIFLVVGVALIFGVLPDTEPVGLSNFIGDHGFMPNGIAGVAGGLLAVAFAFGGIELVTIAAAESDKPSESIKTAVRSTIWRISLFYLGAVLVICFLLPYDQIGGASDASESPFTLILEMAHIPGVVGLMEGVIVLSLLSAFNAQFYGTSRFVFSLAKRGDAPQFFARTTKDGVPLYAVMLSVFFAFVSVALQFSDQKTLIGLLFNAVGGCLIVIWFMTCLSEIKLRPELEAEAAAAGRPMKVRMWAYPVLPWITVAMLIALTVLMLFDAASRSQVIAVVVLAVVLAALSFLAPGRNNDKYTHDVVELEDATA
ncbi:amino acid transporter [Corynebacterium sp. 13CS0277]|uniref:amino acid permease n=1 Tax=Corynebacterium sp. 13CS0277 TaxID=2071994 RepID=UPI000D0454AC|nr:amino acid permease [Corynebacterium sp. 13CS0277]PRQ12282.1 amino acid transporter [Corynebacterium sp. 13CS0277]